jgi:hypothetical protein
MPQRFYTKKGDRGRPLVVTLMGSDGVVQDLTGATSVKLNARLKRETTRKINAGVCTVLNPPTAGKVQYDPAAGDVDTAGTLQCEFVATLNAKEITFPSGPEPDQYLEWIIQDEI